MENIYPLAAEKASCTQLLLLFCYVYYFSSDMASGISGHVAKNDTGLLDPFVSASRVQVCATMPIYSVKMDPRPLRIVGENSLLTEHPPKHSTNLNYQNKYY